MDCSGDSPGNLQRAVRARLGVVLIEAGVWPRERLGATASRI
jgi:hypothetical protein